jgi:hypothetical protein
VILCARPPAVCCSPSPVRRARAGRVPGALERGPLTILVDGFGWEAPGAAATIGAVEACAARVGAEIWMTARDAAIRALFARSFGAPRP